MNGLPSVSELVLAALTAFLRLPAPEGGPDEVDAPNLRPQALASFNAVAEIVEDHDRYWSAPFVLADKETREVIVWGMSTGMFSGDPVEFFVIGEQSGQDYEAVMTTFARPSHIHEALERIGLKAIGPVDPDAHRFWPRGDRVHAAFEVVLQGAEDPDTLPAHSWITHPDESVMDFTPWVFVGSAMLPSAEDPEVLVYAADAFSPNSVASTFNLRNTIFDLPMQGPKSVVYGNFLRNPAIETKEAQPMLLRLRPLTDEEAVAERELTLRVRADGIALEGWEGDAPEALSGLRAALEAEPDAMIWLTVDFGSDLTLAEARRAARVVEELEEHLDHVRVEPPVSGQPYYQALYPPERFRERARRPSQPLEMHLQRTPAGHVHATVMELEEIWGEEGRRPTILERPATKETPDEWEAFVREDLPLIRVLFVFAPAEMKLGETLRWLDPVLDVFRIVYVYPEGE